MYPHLCRSWLGGVECVVILFCLMWRWRSPSHTELHRRVMPREEAGDLTLWFCALCSWWEYHVGLCLLVRNVECGLKQVLLVKLTQSCFVLPIMHLVQMVPASAMLMFGQKIILPPTLPPALTLSFPCTMVLSDCIFLPCSPCLFVGSCSDSASGGPSRHCCRHTRLFLSKRKRVKRSQAVCIQNGFIATNWQSRTEEERESFCGDRLRK